MPELVVATFNLHAGVDGWGRPFDVVAACAALDADVLVLQENWTPDGGGGVAELVASSLGYALHEVALSGAILLGPSKAAGPSWGPRPGDPLNSRRLWVADPADVARLRKTRWGEEAKAGKWGVALLSRLPVTRVDVLELGQLKRDRMSRAAILATLEVGNCPVTVAGTHLAHFTAGAVVQWLRLRKGLPAASLPAVIAGDLNFWGPPLKLALPGWKRAVRARTYPSWHAHSQIDHIFVSSPVGVVAAERLKVGRSDHWPVRARLVIGRAGM